MINSDSDIWIIVCGCAEENGGDQQHIVKG